MKVVIIGGGPAGMLAGIAASKGQNDVTIIEKNNILGKKILVTGKGRCNITNGADITDFIKNIPGNGKFLFSSFKNFTNVDIINILEKNGVKVKEERGKRIFPTSDRAEDVRKALEKEVYKSHVNVMLNSVAKKLIVVEEKGEKKVCGVELENGKTIAADKVIIATGGLSYSRLGSTGDGYRLAKSVGHSIKEPRGSLVPLEAEKNICQRLQGLSLKNVKINIEDIEKKKSIYDDFGEMLFTHFGVSGPTILSASSHMIRYKDIDLLCKNGKIKLFIDLKPALSHSELDKRIIRDFELFINKDFKNSLDRLLPKKMIEVIVDSSQIDPYKKVNNITKEERERLVNIIKKFEIEINGFRTVDEAIITAGGIDIKEINPKTMESKLIKDLYFAGEVIDIDAYTGGFNLQIAYSTGYTAGLDIKEV